MTFLAIEGGMVVIALAMAFTCPNLGSRWLESIERRFGELAKRRALSVIVVGLTALVLRAALLPIQPIPQPLVPDEFAYLLLSDTFAHGRVTNPSNPMWAHFQTLFVIWHPTYTAKFWPAQGLVMAIGQALTGKPFWGVWLSVGLMCAAITWMLQGWLTPGWALLGGFLAVIRLGTFSYWANSYWGGAVAAIGGALVLGALPRLKQQQKALHALLMGLGFAILANSRPYEGLFFGIPVAASMLVWLWKMKRPDLGRALKHVMVPVLAVITLTLVAMGYYFWRTTGSPLNTPYFVYEHNYNPVPYFPWQSLRRIPVYRSKSIRRFYLKSYALPQYRAGRSVSGIATVKLIDVLYFWTFFFGPVFTLPLVLAWAILPYGFAWQDISPRTCFLILVCVIAVATEALPLWFYPHYAAPLTGVLIALILVAMQRVRHWRWHGSATGIFVTRAIPSICVFLFILRVGAGVFNWPPVSMWPEGITPTWCTRSPQNLKRAKVLAELERRHGRQLVLVHTGPHHDIRHNMWVANPADLNSAKVIWAHDMGPAANEKLIHYFKNRHVWLVDADDNPPKVEPYPRHSGHSRILAERGTLK